ncbi:MAG TPA: hypothetical protein VF624_08795 [Tepidisphaeraceae bacterium]|jgi:hypothetical protein
MTEPLPYATAPQQQTRPAVVGFILGVLALGLIFLGGCFLIGILLLHANNPISIGGKSDVLWTPGVLLFAAVLYACAAACFGGGAFVMAMAVRKLLAA